MSRLTMIGFALLAMSALGVVVAAPAQGETAPSFTVSGTRLIAGKTHNFDSRGVIEPFELETQLHDLIICSGQSTEAGVLLGSNPGNPGRDSEIVVLSGCKLIQGNGSPNCELTTTTLRTNPLVSEQVEDVEEGHVGKKLLEELLPAETANGFLTLNFAGTGCELLQTKVTGSVAGQALFDTADREPIELGQAPQQRTSWIVKFPAEPIDEVWLISGGVGKIQKVALVAFGEFADLIGQTLTLLASSKYAPEPNTLWSPLP
jgi:hypothetical protein